VLHVHTLYAQSAGDDSKNHIMLVKSLFLRQANFVYGCGR